ncbi:hypothetical protein [Aquiflexum lacus]|uniref:hypothetical protein n=1 Tax=Aquiflexum lacus TaxID=2483805 RepID=UPI0018948AED|nr:hypothetical protein [Aquiflexum lacus]
MRRVYFTMFVCLLGFQTLLAQDDIFGIDSKARDKGRKSQSNIGNVFRNAVSNFSFEMSSGGSFHTNQMQFFSQFPNQYPIKQYRNLEEPQSIAAGDTISFNSNQIAIPINLGVKLNLFNTLMVGAGYGRELGKMDNLRGGDFEFQFENANYTLDRVFGSVGLVVYDARKRAKFLNWRYRQFSTNNIYMQSEKNQRIRQNYPWRFLIEAEFGNLYMRKSFDGRVLPSEDPFYNVGLRVEREFSEYARFFAKTGVEFRNYNFGTENLDEFQNIKQNLYLAQIGISISLPGTKRCKVHGCGVVMRHVHDGIEYRGSSIFNFQNRKVGQWY